MSKTELKGSNLVKAYRLDNADTTTRLIDSNSMLQEKLDRIRLVMPTLGSSNSRDGEKNGGFVDGIDALMLDALTADNGSVAADGDGSPESNIIKANSPEPDMPVYDGPSPDELIAEAKEQIEEMKQAAEADIEALKANAYDEGMRAGYNDGKAKALEEADAARSKLEEERLRFEEECKQYIADIEPQLISTLTSIYEKVIQINLSEQQDVIINLLHNTLNQVESSKYYLIRVSEEDYNFVKDNKDKLITASMPVDVAIDVVEDCSMKAGDALIESENGIYDSGVGTQLEALKKKMEILSFVP